MITTDSYEDARKKIAATKTKENLLCIAISYDLQLVLPYKDGISFMASLANAGQIKGSYSSKRLTTFATDAVTA